MLAASDQRSSDPVSQNPMKKPPASPNSVLLAAEHQWIFTEAELARTPSALDGMPLEKERENRGKGVNFIIQVGIQLKLPQMTLATASIFLQRFFMRHSMVDKPDRPGLHYYTIAATATFLATKVEENCRKMKELVIACCRVAQKNPNLVVDEQTKEYWKWRDAILHNEDILLETICFDLSLQPPYKILFDYLIYLGEGNNKKLRNAAWAFINDSNLTMLCLLFTSRTIAAAALYCAAKHCDIAFADEDRQPWWEVFGVKLQDIRRACNYVASVYEHSPLKRPENVYTRTPEDGDPLVAKTRVMGSQTPDTPRLNGAIEKLQGGPPISLPGSGQGSNKRLRADSAKESKLPGDNMNNDGYSTIKHKPSSNGSGHLAQGVADDRDSKRMKTEETDLIPVKAEQTAPNMGKPDKLTTEREVVEEDHNSRPNLESGSAEKKDEELSEEGEVEP